MDYARILLPLVLVALQLSRAAQRGFRQLVGTGSDLVSFSFHPRKLLTTGEGGMVTTDSESFVRYAAYQSLEDLDRRAANELGPPPGFVRMDR